MRRASLILVLLLALGLVTSVGVAWASATMWRGVDVRNPLTRTWFNEPTVEVGQANQWRLAQWTDATLTRRWGWGWRPEWFEDPREAYLRRVTLGSDAEDRTWGEIDLPAFSRAQRRPPEEAPPITLFVNALPSFEEREAGWPMRCLRVRWVAGDDRLDTPGERIRGGVLASYWVYPWGSSSFDPAMMHWNTEDEHAIPLTPMWVGLAINTLFWALVWVVVLVTPALPFWSWRRWRWRTRERRGLCQRCGYAIGLGNDRMPRCPECGSVARPRRAGFARGMATMLTIALIAVLALTAGFALTRTLTADRLPALHRAAARGDADRVRTLLAGGTPADASAPDLRTLNTSPMQGARPIDWAAARGHADAIDELVKAGASPSMVGSDRSPLALALACGHAAAADRLLAAGAAVADAPRTTPAPIAVAAWLDDAALLGRLFDRADSRAAGPVPLEVFLVALTGRSGTVQRMVLDRTAATPQAVERQAVSAFRFDDLPLLDELRARGFDPRPASAHFIEYLDQAADPLAAVQALHERGVDLRTRVTNNDTTPHVLARKKDAGAALRWAAGLGLPVDATNANMRTPLHAAAASGNSDAVRALLDLGADASAQDLAGDTARTLWWYAGQGDADHTEILRLLQAAEDAP